MPDKKLTSLEIKAFDYINTHNLDAKDWNMFESFEQLEVKAMPEGGCKCEIGEMIAIKGYLSTFKNVDRQGDIVAGNAFDLTLKSQKIYPLQRNHDYSSDDMMGDFKAKVDDNGIYIEGEIICTPENMHECMMIKAGKLKTLSMGGIFNYAKEKDKKGNNIIENVMLLEGSIVPIPANAKCNFTVKSLIAEKADEVPAGETKQVSAEQRASEFKKMRLSGGK
jgi:HK97 family phage prohead protease